MTATRSGNGASTLGRMASVFVALALLVALPLFVALHVTAPPREQVATIETPPAVKRRPGPAMQALAKTQPVSREFVTDLPPTLLEIVDVDQRKATFVRILLPLVLKVNEEIRADRARILVIANAMADTQTGGDPISVEDFKWMSDKTAYYGLERPADPDSIPFTALLSRVDEVPVSLALAQGAIESGWGRSRFAQEGRAIFGEWTWGDHPGMAPLARPDGEIHEVRKFESLLDSVRAYVRNLNRHAAYETLRVRRAELRADGQPVTGMALAKTLVGYSELGEEYVSDLQAVIRGNEFTVFNGMELAPDLAFATARASD